MINLNEAAWIYEEANVTKRYLSYECDEKAVTEYDLEESIV